MKKLILSFSLIFSFAAYIIYQQAGSQNYTYVVPANNQDGSSSSSSIDTISAIQLPQKIPKQLKTKTNSISSAVYQTQPPKKVAASRYKDGEYNGTIADAYYGNVQIKAVIAGGKIADVQFLDYPQDRRTSIEISNYAMPILKTEAIQIQSAEVDIVSGATQTSQAFRDSLAVALAEAKN